MVGKPHLLQAEMCLLKSAPQLHSQSSLSACEVGLLADDLSSSDAEPLLNATQETEGAKTTGDAQEECLDPPRNPLQHALGFIAFFGSGLLGAVSYLDPGNLEADIQLGVTSGYSLLWWTAICCLCFGFLFQCLSGRVGLVSGKDLAQHLGERYPKKARWLTWFLIEIAIIGADIQETVGSALAITILTGGRVALWVGCIIVSLSAFTLLLLEQLGFRQLEALFGLFIGVEALALGLNFFKAPIAAKDVAYGIFVPQLSKETLPVAVAALGALVMPYNVFFQSSVISARPRDTSTDAKKTTLLRYMRLENFLVLMLAFVVNMFVICVFADGFYGVLSGDEVGLESGGDHLGLRYGSMFRTVWAIGLLASGQVATIGLTYAGQLVMAGLLGIKVKAGPRMIATRLVALIPTVTLAVVFEASHTFDLVAQTLNVVQSIILPFALIPVIHVAADKKVLGSFASNRWITAFAAVVATLVCAVNGYVIVDYMRTEFPNTPPGIKVGFSFFIAGYYLLCGFYAVGPDRAGELWDVAREKIGKGLAWARAHALRADFPALLEVHH